MNIQLKTVRRGCILLNALKQHQACVKKSQHKLCWAPVEAKHKISFKQKSNTDLGFELMCIIYLPSHSKRNHNKSVLNFKSEVFNLPFVLLNIHTYFIQFYSSFTLFYAKKEGKYARTITWVRCRVMYVNFRWTIFFFWKALVFARELPVL